MIGKILLTRVEPCFRGGKPECGEVSRVKKDKSSEQQCKPPKMEGVDTFTSSKDVDTQKKPNAKSEKK